jgi:hypothetical protein
MIFIFSALWFFLVILFILSYPIAFCWGIYYMVISDYLVDVANEKIKNKFLFDLYYAKKTVVDKNEKKNFNFKITMENFKCSSDEVKNLKSFFNFFFFKIKKIKKKKSEKVLFQLFIKVLGMHRMLQLKFSKIQIKIINLLKKKFNLYQN